LTFCSVMVRVAQRAQLLELQRGVSRSNQSQ